MVADPSHGADKWNDAQVQSAINSPCEHVCDSTCLLSEDVRVDPKGDRRIGVAETGRNHVHGYAGKEQRGRVQVS